MLDEGFIKEPVLDARKRLYYNSSEPPVAREEQQQARQQYAHDCVAAHSRILRCLVKGRREVTECTELVRHVRYPRGSGAAQRNVPWIHATIVRTRYIGVNSNSEYLALHFGDILSTCLPANCDCSTSKINTWRACIFVSLLLLSF